MIAGGRAIEKKEDCVVDSSFNLSRFQTILKDDKATRPGGALPYMGYIGMCRCEGYGFQTVYSRIGYINQSLE